MAPVAFGDVLKLHEGLAGGGADHVLEGKGQTLGDAVPVEFALLAEIDGRNLHLSRKKWKNEKRDEQRGKCTLLYGWNENRQGKLRDESVSDSCFYRTYQSRRNLGSAVLDVRLRNLDSDQVIGDLQNLCNGTDDIVSDLIKLGKGDKRKGNIRLDALVPSI